MIGEFSGSVGDRRAGSSQPCHQKPGKSNSLALPAVNPLTAHRYMQIANRFGHLARQVSVQATIYLGALVLLSHEAMPDEIRVMALELT